MGKTDYVIVLSQIECENGTAKEVFKYFFEHKMSFTSEYSSGAETYPFVLTITVPLTGSEMEEFVKHFDPYLEEN